MEGLGRIITCIDFSLISKQPFYYRKFRGAKTARRRKHSRCLRPTKVTRGILSAPAPPQSQRPLPVPPQASAAMEVPRDAGETGCRRGQGRKPARRQSRRRGQPRTRLSKKGGGSPRPDRPSLQRVYQYQGASGGSVVKNLPASWETRVPSLLPEDPTGPGATKPVARPLKTTHPSPRSLQQERPRGARPAQRPWRVDPAPATGEKPAGSCVVSTAASTTKALERVWGKEPLHTGGGDVSWRSRCCRQDGVLRSSPPPGTDKTERDLKRCTQALCAHSGSIYSRRSWEHQCPLADEQAQKDVAPAGPGASLSHKEQ